MTDKKKQGKTNRKAGADFEKRVRADLESKGWIVDRWSNNVEWPKENINLPSEERIGKLVAAKVQWAKTLTGWMPRGLNSGFPDFIAFKYSELGCAIGDKDFGFPVSLTSSFIIGVEVKINKYLDKIEREKCDWLLKNEAFSKILIAYKEKEGRKIVVRYKEYERNI